ncbi:MAG: MFS transporter [Chloroflexi bacterium]|nr:MFS transporter [Chloroflexota bacterium]
MPLRLYWHIKAILVRAVTEGPLRKVDRFFENLINRRFFYGWIIVAINLNTTMVTAGLTSYGLAFFVVPMSQDLGISRGAFSSVSLFRLIPVFLLPFFGFWTDLKHGPRLLVTLGSILAGSALIVTSTVHSLWQYYLIYGVMFGVALNAMGGQVVGQAVLAKWFVRRRGRAMAIGAMGISVGGFVVAPLSGWLISAFGWRTAWVVLGVIMLLSVGPLSALFMRRQPEDIGLLPDGDTSPGSPRRQRAQSPKARVASEYPWTAREAVKTRALWTLMGIQMLASLGLSALLVHQVAYIRDKGYDAQDATTVATILAFFAFLAKLPWGYLAEKVHIRWALSLCLIPAGLALFLLVWAQGLPMLYTYAVLEGLFLGGWQPLQSVLWATYFGREHMGAIRGVVAPVGSLVASTSPVIAGWMWDRLGSYDVPFTLYAIAWIVAGMLVPLTRPPKPVVMASVGAATP